MASSCGKVVLPSWLLYSEVALAPSVEAGLLWQARSKILSKHHFSAAIRLLLDRLALRWGRIPNLVSIPTLKVGMLSGPLKDLEAKGVVSIPTFYPIPFL